MTASLVVNKKSKYDYATINISASVPGKGNLGIIEGVSSIDYTPAVERAKYYGTSRLPLFGTDGVFDADGTLVMAKAYWDSVIVFCKNSQIGYFELQLNIVVVYGNRNMPVNTDTLEKVKWKEIAQSHKQGPDPLEVSLGLWIEGRVLLNGVPPFTVD